MLIKCRLMKFKAFIKFYALCTERWITLEIKIYIWLNHSSIVNCLYSLRKSKLFAWISKQQEFHLCKCFMYLAFIQVIVVIESSETYCNSITWRSSRKRTLICPVFTKYFSFSFRRWNYFVVLAIFRFIAFD